MKQSLEIKSKNIDIAISQALGQLRVNREDIDVEVVKEPVKGFLGLIGNKDGVFKITVKEKIEASVSKEQPLREKEITIVDKKEESKETLKESDVVRDFVLNIVNNLNMEAQVDVNQEKNVVKVNITGKDLCNINW